MPDLSQSIEPGTGSASPVDEELSYIEALKRRGGPGRVVRLSEEQEQDAMRRVLMDFHDAASINTQFRANHLEFLKMWRGITEKKTFPFEGASNIRVPFLSTGVEQTKARLMKGLMGESGSQVGHFSALSEAITEEALEDVNEWFAWELEEVVEIRKSMREIIHHMLIDGFAVAMPYYEHTEREVRYTREFELSDQSKVQDQCEQALMQIFSESKEMEVLRIEDMGVYTIQHRELDGDWREAEVSFSIEEDGSLCAEVTTVEVVFDGVRLDVPDTEDIVVINSSSTIDGLPFFGSRYWLSRQDYIDGVASKLYINYKNKDDNEQVANTASTKIPMVVSQDRVDALDAEEGARSVDPQVSYAQKMRSWIEIYRWEGKLPIGPRGAMVGVVLWVAARARRVIRIQRLDELTRYGDRTPVKFDFIRQPNRFYSIGLVEWGRHIQAELDAIHNQRLDSGLISMVPFGFYTPMAGHAKTILQLEPGKMYPVKDPTGVIFPQINWRPQWGFQEEQLVKGYGQEQIGLNEPATGTFVSKRMSASEYAGTSESLDLRTEFILEGVMEPFRQLLYRIFELYQQHMPDGRVFQVSTDKGERILKKIGRSRINVRMRLHLASNPQQLSASLQRDIAANMLQLVINPLLLQMGITKPDTVAAAVKKIAKASGYKGVPFHEPDMPPDSDEPETEHKRMLLGEDVQPSPVENFQQHLAAHMMLAADPEINELMPPGAQAMLAGHIQKTMQLQEVIRAMQMQEAANAATMQKNLYAQGIRPGMAGGSSPGAQASPGTAEEGVAGGPSETGGEK